MKVDAQQYKNTLEMIMSYAYKNEVSESTKKNYWRSIKQMTEHLSDSEREEYITAEGYLKKSLSADIIDRVLTESQFIEGEDGKRRLKSASSYVSWTSALPFWHKESDGLKPEGSTTISMDIRTKDRLHDLNLEVKRIKASEKSEKVERFITFADYKFLASLALSDRTHSQLCHSSIVLGWNLMARSSDVSGLNWNDFAASGDSITVLYHRPNSGQNIDPISIYANPLDPMVCPFLALGVKICSETFSASLPLKLYSGFSSSSSTFSSWLQSKSKKLSQSELEKLTVSPSDISATSFRKGAVKYISSLENGPDPEHARLRSINSIMSINADIYVGRATCGLNIDKEEFAAICPHFKNDSVDLAEAISCGFMQSATDPAKAAVRLMVASVVYHWDWLLENLPAGHPFFTSTIYTRNLNLKWKDFLSAGFYENKETGMKATGISRFVRMAYEMKRVEEMAAKIAAKIATPQIDNNRVIPVSDVDSYIERIISPALERISAQLEELNARARNAQPPTTGIASGSTPLSSSSRPKEYTWGDRDHFYPEGFEIPRISPLKLWDLWIFGDGNVVTIPYHMLNVKYLIRKEQTQFSRAKKVMERIRAAANLSYEELRNLGHVESMKIGQRVYEEKFGQIDHYLTMNISTAYHHMSKLDKMAKATAGVVEQIE